MRACRKPSPSITANDHMGLLHGARCARGCCPRAQKLEMSSRSTTPRDGTSAAELCAASARARAFCDLAPRCQGPSDKSRTGRCARGGRCPPPSRARRCQRLGRPETTGLTILSAAERPVDRRVFRDWAFLGVQFFRRRHARDGDAAFPARRGAGGRHQGQSAAGIQAAGLDSGSTDYSQRVDRR
jgi:hypothetical protein